MHKLAPFASTRSSRLNPAALAMIERRKHLIKSDNVFIKAKVVSTEELLKILGPPLSHSEIIKEDKRELYAIFQTAHLRKKIDPISKPLLRKVRNNAIILADKELKIRTIAFGTSATVSELTTYLHFKMLSHATKLLRGTVPNDELVVFHLAIPGNAHLFGIPNCATRVLYREKGGTLHYTSSTPEKFVKDLFEYEPTESELKELSLEILQRRGKNAPEWYSTIEVRVDDYALYREMQAQSGYLDLSLVMRDLDGDFDRDENGDPVIVGTFEISGSSVSVPWKRPDCGLLLILNPDTPEETVYGALPVQKRFEKVEKKKKVEKEELLKKMKELQEQLAAL